MPSDERVSQILEALGEHRAAFRDVVEATVTDVRSYLVSSSSARDGRTERMAAELGPFGSQRFTVERLATLFAQPETLDAMTAETVEKALNTLADLARREEDLFVADVPPGEGLRHAVDKALGEIGRVFGAARIVERVRTRRYRYSEHVRALGCFPFREWTRAERRMAPPLVVVVDGRDLHAIEVAEFLDGALKLIVVVQGESAPAPLVRLITPQTYVMQTAETSEVRRLIAWDGAGIAAVVPDSAARFVHDPSAGPELWDRLSVSHVPEGEPRRAIGSLSAAQQAEELRQLRALARRPPASVPAAAVASGAPEAVAAATSAPEPAEPVDKLAAWLLSQADMTNVEEG
jgi:hypothetical protein